MATPDLVNPPPHLPPPAVLQLSQSAPHLLSKSPTSSLPYPLSILFSAETPDSWAAHENLLKACLRTGDDSSARQCLDRLVDRFGADNERVLALQGLYAEATAKDQAELNKVLGGYEAKIKEDPTSFAIRKRRVALLRHLNRPTDAIAALTEIVDASPTDVEAWAELADLYLTQGMYAQAVYCQEEVLLIFPYAWTAHARLGEILYLSAPPSPTPADVPLLSSAARRFCRALELCDDYLRAHYGLKLACQRLLPLLAPDAKAPPQQAEGELPPLDRGTVEKLHEAATGRLAELVRRKAGERGDGYAEAEVIAARELLDRDGKVER